MIDMTVSKKPNKRPSKKPANKKVVHVCNKEATIDRQGVLLERLSLVTLGNGTPENGLLFMFRAYLEKHKEDEAHLKEIKATIKEAIEANTHTANALELYKKEMEGIDKGRKDIEDRAKDTVEKDAIAETLKLTKIRDTWYKILTILGIAIAIYFGVRNDKKNDTILTTTTNTEQQVKDQGVPFVMNSRGEFLALPDSTVIKFLPKDSVEYLIMKNVK